MANPSSSAPSSRRLLGPNDDGVVGAPAPMHGTAPGNVAQARPMSRLSHLGGYRRAGKERTKIPTAGSATGPGEVLLSPTTWTQTLANVGSSGKPVPSSPSTRGRVSPRATMQPRPAGGVSRSRDDPFRTPSASSKASASQNSTDRISPYESADPMAVLQEKPELHSQAPLFGESRRADGQGILRHRSSISSVSSSSRHSSASRRASSALSLAVTDPLRCGAPPSSSPAFSSAPMASPSLRSMRAPNENVPPLPTNSAVNGPDSFEQQALKDPFITGNLVTERPALSPLALRRASAIPSPSQPWSSDWSPPLSAETRRPSAPQLQHTPTASDEPIGLGFSLGPRRGKQPMTAFGASLQSYRFGALSAADTDGGDTRSASKVAGKRGRTSPNGRDASNAKREETVRMWKQWAIEYQKNTEESKRRRSENGRADQNADASTFVHALSSRSSFDSYMSSSGGTSRGRAGSRTSSMRYPLLSGFTPDHVYSRGDPGGSAASTSVLPLRTLPHRSSTLPSTTCASVAPAAQTYNPFAALRRRFAFRRKQSNVATQLLGELFLALEEYVALYGRKVKVATAAIPGGGGSRSGSPRPAAEPFGPLTPLEDLCTHGRDYVARADTSTPSLEALCDEVVILVGELIDVVPAFGTALTVGGYGPLALRREIHRSPSERFSAWAPDQTGEASGRWWAERLLRDLLEGLVGDDAGARERFWAYYSSGGGGVPLTKEEEVLTGALAALVEEDETERSPVGGEGESSSERERELLESGMRRWKEFQARNVTAVAV